MGNGLLDLAITASGNWHYFTIHLASLIINGAEKIFTPTHITFKY